LFKVINLCVDQTTELLSKTESLQNNNDLLHEKQNMKLIKKKLKVKFKLWWL